MRAPLLVLSTPRRGRALFVSLSALVASAVLLTACGGGTGEAAKTPPSSAGSSQGTGGAASNGDSPAGSSGGATSAAAVDAGPTSTTTVTLKNSGDLQGAKLATTSSTQIDNKSDGGARPDPHGGEPGRKREDIQALVVAHRDEARKCYDDALKAHPGIEGNLDIKWTIDPKGAITDISVDDAKSDIHEPSVGNCVIAVIKRITFSGSPKGFETRPHYPFNFHPRGSQTRPASPPNP